MNNSSMKELKWFQDTSLSDGWYWLYIDNEITPCRVYHNVLGWTLVLQFGSELGTTPEILIRHGGWFAKMEIPQIPHELTN